MKRNSKIFGDYNVDENSYNLYIKTKFPEKWVLIDTENEQYYQGTRDVTLMNQWKKIDIEILQKLCKNSKIIPTHTNSTSD